MTTPNVLEVEDLVVSYQRDYLVLDRVNLVVGRGEVVGVVGESGCGKTTLARAIVRLVDADAGAIRVNGTDVTRLRGGELRRTRRHVQMVFQDPFASLDPHMSVVDIVTQPLHVHRRGTRPDRAVRAAQVLHQLGIADRLFDARPPELSGGQRQRVAVARAMVLDPDLIVFDEAVSALDVSVRAQVLGLLQDVRRAMQLSYLFIVHDLAIAEYFCDRIAVLYLGRVVEVATAADLFRTPLHPYSVALFSAAPQFDRTQARTRILLEGEPQSRRPDRGCPFAPRCPVGRDRPRCHDETPALREVAGHSVACHFAGELA